MRFNPSQQSDEELVIHYRDSLDKLAVGELFKRHALMCFTVCNKYLKDEEAAKDASMQVFEKLFDDLLKHEILNFKSWLHSVCRNHSLMQLRKPELQLRTVIHDEENEFSFMESLSSKHQEENTGEVEQRLQLLEEAIKDLNNKQQTCIRLFYLEQKSYDEVSELTGFSALEVKSFIQNGKRNLKILLSKKGIATWIALGTWILQYA